LGKRFFEKFTPFDLILIALLAGSGVATKPFVYMLARIITGPLFVPAGVVAGGFFMLWIVLACALVRKRGTAFLTGLVQAIIVTATGLLGSHGIFSLVTYTFPVLLVELGLLLSPRYVDSMFTGMYAGLLANVGGTFLSNVVFFRLPAVPLLFSLAVAALSGALGGIMAYQLMLMVNKWRDGRMPNEE